MSRRSHGKIENCEQSKFSAAVAIATFEIYGCYSVSRIGDLMQVIFTFVIVYRFE